MAAGYGFFGLISTNCRQSELTRADYIDEHGLKSNFLSFVFLPLAECRVWGAGKAIWRFRISLVHLPHPPFSPGKPAQAAVQLTEGKVGLI
jgi:hypothetical protein